MGERSSESLLSSLAYLGVARGGVLVMNLATTSHLARTLDAANFGVNSFAISLTAYFLIVVNLGYETFVTRSVAFDRTGLRSLVDSMVAVRLLLAAGMFALLVLTVLALDLDATCRIVVLVQGINLFGSALGLTCVYQGLKQMRVVAAREFLSSFVSMVGVLVFVRGPGDVLLAACIAVATMAVTNGAILLQYVRDFGPLRLHWPRRADLAQARHSMDYFWSMLMITITNNMHLVLLGLLRTQAAVGLFSVGWKLFNFAVVLPNLINTLFLPRIANVTVVPGQRARSSEALMRAALVCGVPVSMIGEALVPQIIVLLFGPAYLPAAPAVAVLLLHALVVAVNIGFGTPLMAVGRQREFLRIVTLGALTGIVLNLALIPPFGIVGAAVATLADELVILALFAATSPEVSVTRTLDFGLRCLLAVTPAAIVAHLVPTLPLLSGSTLVALLSASAAGSAIYVVGLRLLRIDLIDFMMVLKRL